MKTTITLIKEAATRGEYKKTSIDMMKEAADILIEAIDDKFTIFVRGGIEIKGRGTESYGNGMFAVTERTLDNLKKTYRVACNF